MTRFALATCRGVRRTPTTLTEATTPLAGTWTGELFDFIAMIFQVCDGSRWIPIPFDRPRRGGQDFNHEMGEAQSCPAMLGGERLHHRGSVSAVNNSSHPPTPHVSNRVDFRNRLQQIIPRTTGAGRNGSQTVRRSARPPDSPERESAARAQSGGREIPAGAQPTRLAVCDLSAEVQRGEPTASLLQDESGRGPKLQQLRIGKPPRGG